MSDIEFACGCSRKYERIEWECCCGDPEHDKSSVGWKTKWCLKHSSVAFESLKSGRHSRDDFLSVNRDE